MTSIISNYHFLAISFTTGKRNTFCYYSVQIYTSFKKGFIMVKNTILLLLLSTVSAANADFWNALWQALNGNDQSSALPERQCACGERAQYKIRILPCCNAVLCESCLTARRHTASIEGRAPRCHDCHISFDYDVSTQHAIENSLADRQNNLSSARPRPTAPPMQNHNDRAIMCASNCQTRGNVMLGCQGNHRMCASCLRGRVASARKKAQGGEPYVTCPRCSDMLTARVINSV